MKRNVTSIEARAQMRARGSQLDIPPKPILGSRTVQAGSVQSAEAEKNSRRMAAFHAKWRGQKEANLEIWSV